MVASGAHHTKISKAAAVFIDAGLGFRALNVLAANGTRNAVRRSWQHLSIQWAVHTLALKQRLARWAGRKGTDKGGHCIRPAKLLALTARGRGEEARGAKAILLGESEASGRLARDGAKHASAVAVEGASWARVHGWQRCVAKVEAHKCRKSAPTKVSRATHCHPNLPSHSSGNSQCCGAGGKGGGRYHAWRRCVAADAHAARVECMCCREATQKSGHADGCGAGHGAGVAGGDGQSAVAFRDRHTEQRHGGRAR
jgi:hypothetical protein